MGAWKRIDGRTVWLTIPLHGEIRPGLLNAIIAESEIPRDEFIKDLQSV
jgi:hypothetical protein